MALVLCTGVHTALVYTRKLALEINDHKVITALDNASLLAACREHVFDIAVICQSCSPQLKREWLGLIRQYHPKVRVLEVYTPDVGAALSNVDGWLEAPVTPNVLSDRLSAILNGHNGAHDRYTMQLEEVRKLCAHAITTSGQEFEAVIEKLAQALEKLR